jgi:beta-galactosidase
LQGADPLAVYAQDYYAGSPAITVNKFGSGHAYYLAARFNDAFLADFYGWLAGQLVLETAIAPPLPGGVSAQVRLTDTAKFTFLLNFEPTAQTIKWDVSGAIDVLSGQPADREITLKGYGFRILEQVIS